MVSDKFPMNVKINVFRLILSIALSACTIHRIDVQQGNVLTQEMVQQLEDTMSSQTVNRRQVRFILGTPMITDPFHRDRWDYLFTLQPGSIREVTEYKRITVFFDGDNVSRIEKTNLN